MPSTLRLHVVTPERQLVDADVEEVTAPGAAGEFGVLPDHITFLTVLVPGRLVYRRGGQRQVLALFGGYAEVADNVMTVLADGAEPSGEIDADAARAAERDAEERLAKTDPGSPEAVDLRRDLGRAHARVAATVEKA